MSSALKTKWRGSDMLHSRPSLLHGRRLRELDAVFPKLTHRRKVCPTGSKLLLMERQLTRSVERGLLVGIKDTFWGQSKEDEAEDAAIEKAHADKVQKQLDEAMRRAKEHRDHQRKVATENLNAAKQDEQKMTSEVNNAVEELNKSTNQLAEAKPNLSRTKAELKKLANKELELVCHPNFQREGLTNTAID